MIFLAVGTQLPFDRLTRAMDAWCEGNSGRAEVFGQIGRVGPDNYRPRHFEWAETISPEDFRDKAQGAEVIVSHAGMGAIITAMTFRKPIVILPRRANLGEHRNEHQMATTKKFCDRSGIFAIQDEQALPDTLDRLLEQGFEAADMDVSSFAAEELIDRLRRFIHDPDRQG